MRLALALLLIMHGVAHLVGVLGAWRLSAKIPHADTLLMGRLHAGETGDLLMGLGWLMTMGLFAIAGVALLIPIDAWVQYAFVATVASTVLCALGLPETKIGLALDLGLVGMFVAGHQLAWW